MRLALLLILTFVAALVVSLALKQLFPKRFKSSAENNWRNGGFPVSQSSGEGESWNFDGGYHLNEASDAADGGHH